MRMKSDVGLGSEEFKDVSEETTKMLIELFKGIDSARVFLGKRPSEIESILSEPPPANGQSPTEMIMEVRQKIIPNSTLIGSPRYFGFVNGSDTMMSLFVD